MTESSPVEITGVWFPECGKKLVWNYGMLRSVISAGYPDGHRLLDCFVRAAKPHFYPELVDDVLEGQSLFFENIGMYIEEGSDKMILVDTTTQETAQIGKDTFLKLLADLGKDFCMTSFALSMKSQVDALHDMTAKVEKFLKKDNLLKEKSDRGTVSEAKRVSRERSRSQKAGLSGIPAKQLVESPAC